MKRILLLNYEFPPLGGGAANATKYLLNEFAKNNNLKIDLITSSVSKYKEEDFTKNIKIYYLNVGKNKKNIHFQSIKDLLIYSWKAYFFAKKLIRKNKYNLIHAFFSVPCGFLAMILKRSFIVSLMGSDVPFHNPKFNKLDKFLFRFLTPYIWKKADCVIANSETLKNSAVKVAKKNQQFKIIKGGVDMEKFKFRKKNTKSDKFIILFVGRLHEVKNVPFLVDAFAKINKNNDSQLWIVGGGSLYKKLKKQVEDLHIDDSVKFFREISHDQLPNIYNNADVFVLPSQNEGMSNTLLEALASGLPIIATNTGGADKLVKNNGFIVSKKSSEEIASAIEKIKSNKKLKLDFSKQSSEIAKEMSWTKAAKQYADIYKNF